MMMRSVRVLCLLVVAPDLLFAASQNQQGDPAPLVRLVMEDRPSLRIGDFLRMDLRARIQADFQRLSPQFETEEGEFDLNRIRFGVEGEFLNYFEYEIDHEFRAAFGGRETKHPWRDAYINFSYLDDFQLKAGQFKIPFSVEQLTGVANLDFVNRSRIADDLAPARDVGLVLHGRFFNRGVGYEAGIFRNDGENSESNTDRRGDRTMVLRVTGTPLRLISLPGDWDEVEVGAALVSTEVPEGLSGLRGRTLAGEVYFPHVFVQGRRLRAGAEASWRPGPFSVQSEFVYVREKRDGQSVRADDLPEKISRGWYLSGTWAITGESKENGIEPRRSFPSQGFGALELAGRYEKVSFGSRDGSGLAYRSPRAENLLGNSDRVITLGVNWYLNRYTKVQINGIRETIEGIERTPIQGRERFWMGVVRLQFSM
jgi:phosphate-selective porin OprO/OprP